MKSAIRNTSVRRTVPWLMASLLGAIIAATGSASAAQHVVELKGKTFLPDGLSVETGDSIEFRNSDPVDHDLLATTHPENFEAQTVPPGESRTVVFRAPGQIEIGCAVHEDMHLSIVVGH